MRVLKTILKILFVIVFIFSVSCSVIFAISSTTTLSNNISSRREIYYKATNKITNSREITIIAKMPYSQNGDISEDKITCSLAKESSTSYNCSMISKLFDKNSNLIRTSYFPGDGYKYTKNANEDKGTKEIYDNASLISYFNSTRSGLTYYLALLSYDEKTIETNSIKYYTKTSFDFNTFSLSKNIDVKYLNEGTTEEFEFAFDKNSYLKDFSYNTYNTSFSLTYQKANLKFPILTSYVEA